MDSGSVLADRCAELGSRVCQRGIPVRRLASERSDHHLSDIEWQQHGQVSAFLAFLEQGGNVDDPDRCDWSAAALFNAALRLLQLFALGSQSDVYDFIIRDRTRRAGRGIEELTWDAWAHTADIASTPLKGRAVRKLPPELASRVYFDFWDRLERPTIDDSFALALTKLLRPQEAVWLIRRYRDGVPTSELAKELVQKDVRYQTADGFTRAARYIDVVVHRAKKRCREQLAEQWSALAQEVA